MIRNPLFGKLIVLFAKSRDHIHLPNALAADGRTTFDIWQVNR
jgi:hypothetical protein